jgi:hypothetical protein
MSALLGFHDRFWQFVLPLGVESCRSPATARGQEQPHGEVTDSGRLPA